MFVADVSFMSPKVRRSAMLNNVPSHPRDFPEGSLSLNRGANDTSRPLIVKVPRWRLSTHAVYQSRNRCFFQDGTNRKMRAARSVRSMSSGLTRRPAGCRGPGRR